MCGIFVCLVPSFIVCLVKSFRYIGLATLALAAFGRLQALRTRCWPFVPASARGIDTPNQYQLATAVNGRLLIDLELV